MPNHGLPTKPCAVCGRSITWRKKWEKVWDDVRYCSDRCRAQRNSQARDARKTIEQTVLELLEARALDATLCPSEVARKLHPDDWREWMEPVRESARRLVAQGIIDIVQHGHVVDPSQAKGPIRLRRRPPSVSGTLPLKSP